MTTWFIPVGISNYEDLEDLTAIPTAVRSLWCYVEDAFEDSVFLGEFDIDNGVWGRTRLDQLFGNPKVAGLMGKVQPQDAVIIYWAGHGFIEGEHRLALSSAGVSIRTRELADWLFRCSASAIVCILDCCGAGDGLDDINNLAVRLRAAEAPQAKEDRRIGLIVSGRSEDTREGALVATMLEVLRRGPKADLGEAHTWGASDRWLRADQLVAAVNLELSGEQQAVADDLRGLSLGAFFPSIWYRSGQQDRPAPIPPDSRARRETERLLATANVPPPGAWVEDHLNQIAISLSDDLPVEMRQQITERIRALCLAQSAQTWVRRTVDRTRITADNLVAARRAATGATDSDLFDTEFDFFDDASTERVGANQGTSAARTLRFVARLVHEVEPDSQHQKGLFEWARSAGLTEDFKINEILAQARAPRGEAVLVLDLRNPPDVAPIDAFPRRAEGTLVDLESGPGSSEVVAITQQDAAGVEAAVSELIGRFRHHRVKVVHLLVPDQLLLFDAAAVQISVHPRLKVSAGVRYDVRVHCDRTEDGRFADFSDHYRDAVAKRVHHEKFDNCAAADGIVDLWQRPPALIFRFAVAPESVETLINAVWTSPIVIWPATEPTNRDEFGEALDREWPDIPHAARSARWLDESASEHLRQLRLFWDDPDWLRLLKENYARQL